MNEEDWERLFMDLDSEDDPYYPGSKRKRRQAQERSTSRKPEQQESWEARPVKKVVNGKELEFYTIGALARALNKSEVSVRLWIRKGYLPTEPYRLPSTRMPDGKVVAGRRLYLKEMIESARDSFERRGLLESRRIEWREHPDLAQEILDSWSQIKADKSQ